MPFGLCLFLYKSDTTGVKLSRDTIHFQFIVKDRSISLHFTCEDECDLGTCHSESHEMFTAIANAMTFTLVKKKKVQNGSKTGLTIHGVNLNTKRMHA